MAPPAAAFGRLVAAYSRAVATSALVEIIPETPLPQSPTLWISWHENNLITPQMEAALASGKDVLIAVDGPTGPRHGIAPGALWLARATDVEIRPAGCWASPALRLPRWDRLMVPLPRAHRHCARRCPDQAEVGGGDPASCRNIAPPERAGAR